MPLVTAEDLAHRYDQPGYADAWAAVQDFNRVQEYAASHPNTGSSAMATELELPRGRIQSWTSGSRPPVVRAVQIADREGWLPLHADDAQLRPWTVLVAWIFAQGAITAAEDAPMFGAPDESDLDCLATVFDRLGLALDIYHEDSNRTREVRLAEHRSLVGRILVALGAPRGTKDDVTGVPTYVRDGATDLQAVFARTYLETAAEYWPWRDGYVIHQDSYPDAYRQSLAALFRAVGGVGEAATAIANEDSVFVPAAIAERVREAAPTIE